MADGHASDCGYLSSMKRIDEPRMCDPSLWGVVKEVEVWIEG